MESFIETGLRQEILDAVKELGFEKPTPIQAQTIPLLLASERDLIALAQTGTGKTAGFGLPIINNVSPDDKHTQAIILCPTRELCLQIAKDLKTFSKNLKGHKVLAVYGGTNIQPQIKALNSGVQIVVGTPGRVLDLVKRKKLLLDQVRYLVLDEADEMLSMGFQDDLDAILSTTPEERQTLLFSATMSKEIEKITKKYMKNAEKIAVAAENAGATTVEHQYYMVQAKDRYEVLKRLADLNPNVYGIVFCRTRRETKDIARKLMEDGYNADALHGDLSQAQRDEVMNRFRTRQLQILVATDVAARGLDVNDLTHVINYNLPDDPESYTHRSGRTGRAGKKGISVAIIHSRETRKIQTIERVSGVKFNKMEVPSGMDVCKKQLYSLIDKIEKTEVDEKQIEPFLPEIYRKLEWLSREELIKRFVSTEFNRFLEYYKNAPDINAGGSQKERKEKSERRRNADYVRLCINVGSRQKLRPERLIGIINEALDSGNAAIGKIDIARNMAFFEIESGVVDKLTKGSSNMDFEGIPIEIEKARGSAPKGGYPKSKKHKRKKEKSGEGPHPFEKYRGKKDKGGRKRKK